MDILIAHEIGFGKNFGKKKGQLFVVLVRIGGIYLLKGC